MKLKHVLAAALAVGLAAPLAQADLIPGVDTIDIVGTNDAGFQWGTGILGGLPHTFGGAGDVYVDELFGSLISVTSSELTPPPGKKFAGLIEITYDATYLVNVFFEHIDIGPIKDVLGGNFINSVSSNVPNATVATDGFSITFDASTFDILPGAGGVVQIQWTQVPAPGSLALLGLAGLMGTRRRRR